MPAVFAGQYMNNRLMAGLVLGCALLVGFAAGRFTASSEPVLKDSSEKTGKTKTATTKHSTYRPPQAETPASANATEAQPENTNTSGRGRREGGVGFMGGGSTNFTAMMKERAASERTNFFANVGLTPAQQADFDDLVSAMNNSLKQRVEGLQAMIQEGKNPRPETFLYMMHDFSSAMMRSYDMMDRTMPAGWRDKAGNNFNMMTFIDPSLRDSFRGLRPPRGDRGPGDPPPQ